MKNQGLIDELTNRLSVRYTLPPLIIEASGKKEDDEEFRVKEEKNIDDDVVEVAESRGLEETCARQNRDFALNELRSTELFQQQSIQENVEQQQQQQQQQNEAREKEVSIPMEPQNQPTNGMSKTARKNKKKRQKKKNQRLQQQKAEEERARNESSLGASSIDTDNLGDAKEENAPQTPADQSVQTEQPGRTELQQETSQIQADQSDQSEPKLNNTSLLVCERKPDERDTSEALADQPFNQSDDKLKEEKDDWISDNHVDHPALIPPGEQQKQKQQEEEIVDDALGDVSRTETIHAYPSSMELQPETADDNIGLKSPSNLMLTQVREEKPPPLEDTSPTDIEEDVGDPPMELQPETADGNIGLKSPSNLMLTQGGEEKPPSLEDTSPTDIEEDVGDTFHSPLSSMPSSTMKEIEIGSFHSEIKSMDSDTTEEPPPASNTTSLLGMGLGMGVRLGLGIGPASSMGLPEQSQQPQHLQQQDHVEQPSREPPTSLDESLDDSFQSFQTATEENSFATAEGDHQQTTDNPDDAADTNANADLNGNSSFLGTETPGQSLNSSMAAAATIESTPGMSEQHAPSIMSNSRTENLNTPTSATPNTIPDAVSSFRDEIDEAMAEANNTSTTHLTQDSFSSPESKDKVGEALSNTCLTEDGSVESSPPENSNTSLTSPDENEASDLKDDSEEAENDSKDLPPNKQDELLLPPEALGGADQLILSLFGIKDGLVERTVSKNANGHEEVLTHKDGADQIIKTNPNPNNGNDLPKTNQKDPSSSSSVTVSLIQDEMSVPEDGVKDTENDENENKGRHPIPSLERADSQLSDNPNTGSRLGAVNGDEAAAPPKETLKTSPTKPLEPENDILSSASPDSAISSRAARTTDTGFVDGRISEEKLAKAKEAHGASRETTRPDSNQDFSTVLGETDNDNIDVTNSSLHGEPEEKIIDDATPSPGTKDRTTEVGEVAEAKQKAEEADRDVADEAAVDKGKKRAEEEATAASPKAATVEKNAISGAAAEAEHKAKDNAPAAASVQAAEDEVRKKAEEAAARGTEDDRKTREDSAAEDEKKAENEAAAVEAAEEDEEEAAQTQTMALGEAAAKAAEQETTKKAEGKAPEKEANKKVEEEAAAGNIHEPGAAPRAAEKEARKTTREKTASMSSADKEDPRNALKKHYKSKLLEVSKAHGSCEQMNEMMDKMEFGMMKCLNNIVPTEDRTKVSDGEKKKEVAAAMDVMNDIKMALLDLCGRSGMQLSGKKSAEEKADPRSIIECSLAEEVNEAFDVFANYVLNRSKETDVNDSRVNSTVDMLQGLLRELNERNLRTLSNLGAERLPRSRPLKTLDQIEKEMEENHTAAEPLAAARQDAGSPSKQEIADHAIVSFSDFSKEQEECKKLQPEIDFDTRGVDTEPQVSLEKQRALSAAHIEGLESRPRESIEKRRALSATVLTRADCLKALIQEDSVTPLTSNTKPTKPLAPGTLAYNLSMPQASSNCDLEETTGSSLFEKTPDVDGDSIHTVTIEFSCDNDTPSESHCLSRCHSSACDEELTTESSTPDRSFLFAAGGKSVQGSAGLPTVSPITPRIGGGLQSKLPVAPMSAPPVLTRRPRFAFKRPMKANRLAEIIRKELWSDDLNVVESGLVELAKMAQTDAPTIARTGGLLAIVQIMEHHISHRGIQVAACHALEKLALDHENEVAIAEVGGLETIISSMMANFEDDSVHEAGWSALWNLTCHQADLTIDIQEGLQALTFCMAEHAEQASVQRNACGTLANLCQSPDRLDALRDAGGFVAIATALEKHWNDEDVRQEASHALTTLLEPHAETYDVHLLELSSYLMQTKKTSLPRDDPPDP